MKERRKSLLENNKNCFNYDLLMNPKINEPSCLRRNGILECPQSISPKHFIIYKVINSNFIVEKPSRYHLNQRIMVTLLAIRYTDIICPANDIQRKAHILCIIPVKNLHYLNMRKHQTYPNWGTFYKLFKRVKVIKCKKRLRTFTYWRRTKRHDN